MQAGRGGGGRAGREEEREEDGVWAVEKSAPKD